jgi:hydroxymethylglutaryl-CoA synthase
MSEPVGIVGYGAYIPRYRIRTSEIARAWGWDAEAYGRGLAMTEKSVAARDQDAITLAVEAAKRAFRRAGTDPKKLGAIYIGSESHPYAVKPSSTVVSEALGMSRWIHTADLEFACKAGTEAMFVSAGLVDSGRMDYALAIGADTSQGAPGDPLEFATSAGAAAFVFGKSGLVATLDAAISYTTDTPDFWRREEERFPRHGGRFTGDPGYFHHVMAAGKKLFEATRSSPKDFAHAVFHQPNGKFPARAGKMLGFSKEQCRAGLLSPRIGNVYSGASPLGLCAALDAAKPGERIFVVSYGSGAGSDGFALTVTERINAVKGLAPTVEEILARPTVQLDYTAYARFRSKIAREEE